MLYDNISHDPLLTTVNIDGPRIGRAIAEALLVRIAEPTLACQPLLLDVGSRWSSGGVGDGWGRRGKVG